MGRKIKGHRVYLPKGWDVISKEFSKASGIKESQLIRDAYTDWLTMRLMEAKQDYMAAQQAAQQGEPSNGADETTSISNASPEGTV